MYTQQASELGTYSSSLRGLREGHDGVKTGLCRDLATGTRGGTL